MKAALLFGLVLVSSFAQAQEDQSVSVELKSTGYFIDKTFRAIASPQVSWNRRKHVLGMGPTMLLVNEAVISDKKSLRLVGIQGNYRFYPYGNDKKVNLYFFDELNLQRMKDQWTAVIWNATSQQYQSYRYVNREYIVQNTSGYGIELPLARRWSLYQGVGIGFYYSAIDGDEVTSEAPEIEDDNGNGYAPFGFSWSVHLGIRFML